MVQSIATDNTQLINDDRPIAVNGFVGPVYITSQEERALIEKIISEQQTAEREPFYSLTASRDVETVKRVIERRYGFTPTDAYCADLITFVEALCDGQ